MCRRRRCGHDRRRRRGRRALRVGAPRHRRRTRECARGPRRRCAWVRAHDHGTGSGDRRPREPARARALLDELALDAARTVDGFREPLLDLRCWWHIVSNMLRHTRSFLGLVAMAGHEDVLDVAPRVRVPTTILWGRRDGTMPVDDAHRLASRMARANVQVGRGSHDRIVTRPRSVAAELVALPVRSLQR